MSFWGLAALLVIVIPVTIDLMLLYERRHSAGLAEQAYLDEHDMRH